MSPTSPESPFMPRPEFIRHQKSPPSSFSLLTLSGPNCIRLYSFSFEVIATLRRFLDQRVIVQGFREDAANNLCEFALDGKPWSSPKSLATERFIVDLLTAIYHCGYNYLSTIDYGREPDDRLAITFSCPVTPADAPITHSPTPQGSRSTLSEKHKLNRVPFALSFPSSTVLRVIHPPLHSTPAILQAVRSSWPRGVESEKKVGDNCFEFKLKGYKWFQEDTFAADSLRHILSLLSSLDTHSFTLQTSISLTNRSRVKDLWIFTGPPSSTPDDAPLPESSSPSLFNTSQTALKRKVPTPEPVASNSHKRLATEPLPHDTAPLSPNRTILHRVATDHPHCDDPNPRSATPPSPSPLPSVSSVLRKAAPRAQVPISVYEGDAPDGTEYRAVLPSVIPEGVPNMTGVGATPDVFYSTSPFGMTEAEREQRPNSPHRKPETPPLHSPPTTPPLVSSPAPAPASSGSSNSTPSTPPDHERERDEPLNRSAEQSLSGPLLSPGAFRDSAFSSNTEMSKEIPIKWTGLDHEAASIREKRPVANDRMSSAGPILPGGWQSSPLEEEKEIAPQSPAPEIKAGTEQALDVDLKQNVRVASPEITDPSEQQLRHSEAALMGMIPPSEPPAVPPLDTNVSGEKQRQGSSGSSSGQGWVLVNVEGKDPTAASPVKEGSKDVGSNQDPQSFTPPNVSPETANGHGKQPTSENASMSPAAKTIVIIDAVDGKKSKQKKDASPNPSRVRRFFSLSRKDSTTLAERLVQDGPSSSGPETERTRSRSGLGQRLRRIRTPEATRNEGNRRSFD